MKEVVLQPVTRIEGHARVYIRIGEKALQEVQLNVVEPPRFFERLLVGRPAEEAPRLTARICGVCHSSHHLASVKAVEAAWDASPPTAARLARELLLTSGHVTSHCLHFSLLSLPDLLRLKKGAVSLMEEKPELAKAAFKLHEYGLRITREVGGRDVHSITAIPGGMSTPIDGSKVDLLREGWEDAYAVAISLADIAFEALEAKPNVFLEAPSSSTYYMALHRNGDHALYDGALRVVASDGAVKHDFDVADYSRYIAEETSDHSYVKYPYLLELGPVRGRYRVGPLARANVAEGFGGKAESYLDRLRSRFGRVVHHPMLYHLARAAELVKAMERVKVLLHDPRLVNSDVLAEAKPREGRGVGVVEAPRGSLIHDYETDRQGLITRANLIVATCQNVPSMEAGVKDYASMLLPKMLSGKLEEASWRIETLVRAYDPCLSCATHFIKIELSP
ncbi:MAG: Ni/Fe hydrogenase subunit alpha [Candidatus Bathyarchaeia archaeon]